MSCPPYTSVPPSSSRTASSVVSGPRARSIWLSSGFLFLHRFLPFDVGAPEDKGAVTRVLW